MCGAHSIDDADVLRGGGTPRVFNEVYAPSTLGIFLREFSFGHTNQLSAVARAHLIALAARTDLLAGEGETMFVDIDSYQHGSPSRGRLPPITVVLGDRLPRCFNRPLRRPNRDGLSPPPDIPDTSWRTARPRRKRRCLQDLIGPTQLSDLLTQRFVLLGHLRRHPRTLAGNQPPNGGSRSATSTASRSPTCPRPR